MIFVLCAGAVLLLLPSCTSASSNFLCQTTIDTYNQYVNIGQFQTAANLTLTDDVQYTIPGPTGICPYCGQFNGKAAVIGLFVDGFLGHFTIVNPLVNLRQIDTGLTNTSSAPPRLLNFNHETFVSNPSKTFGGVPRYFSVPVIHDFIFDAATCRIAGMVLYQDPYAVTQVYAAGKVPAMQPIMPFVTINPPPNSVTSTVAVQDFQVFPSETAVDPTAARGVVAAYYAAIAAGNGALSLAAAQRLFMGLDYAIPQAVASYAVPGDPAVLPFAGLFMDVAQIVQAHALRASLVNETLPTASDPAALVFVVDGGSVAVQYSLTGTALATGKKYTCSAVDYFQVLMVDTTPVIGRVSRFFDTYAVTQALSS